MKNETVKMSYTANSKLKTPKNKKCASSEKVCKRNQTVPATTVRIKLLTEIPLVSMIAVKNQNWFVFVFISLLQDEWKTKIPNKNHEGWWKMFRFFIMSLGTGVKKSQTNQINFESSNFSLATRKDITLVSSILRLLRFEF